MSNLLNHCFPHTQVVLLFMLLMVGCQRERQSNVQGDSAAGPAVLQPGISQGQMDAKPTIDKSSQKRWADGVRFKDQVVSNAEPPADLESLVFKDTDGNEVALKQFLGKKHIVLVFTQGFSGSLCPYCITQTSRLIANHELFQQRDAQVLVVYPGKRDHLNEFVEAAKTKQANVANVPFPLLLDEDLAAAAFFRIKSRLAHPSTFIIDKDGAVKLAYVGADRSADRPSIKAMLRVLDEAT